MARYGKKHVKKPTTGLMFQLSEDGSGILVINYELRQSYKIGRNDTFSLPEIAIIHHRTWFCIGPKKPIPQVGVATAELQSMLLHDLEHCEHLKAQQQQTVLRELQFRYLRSALACLLLRNVEVTVHADNKGRPKLEGQLSKRYHFGDLHFESDYIRIGLGNHVGAAEYCLDLPYDQLQEGAPFGLFFDPADLKSFPIMTDWFQDIGSSGTPKAPVQLRSSRLSTTIFDWNEVGSMEC